MDKNQNRIISSNFFNLSDAVNDESLGSQADIVEVNQSEFNRGDDTGSVLSGYSSELVQIKTTDLVETTSQPLEYQGVSQGSTEGTQYQQLEPLKNADVALPTSELDDLNISVVEDNVETGSLDNIPEFTRVALKSAASSGTYGLKDTTSSGTEDLPNVALNLIDTSSNSTAITISSGSASIGSDVTFSHVTLGSSTAYSYTSGVSLSDVGASLRHVVGMTTLTGQALQAGDVDNSGSITLSDVGAALRHVVGMSTINTFDLVDGSGTRITSLGPSTANTTLYLVENGDVSLDGAFVSLPLLVGGDGNDTLSGGSGNDALTGGLGADTFEFTRTSGNTSVTDFNILEGDTLRFYNTGGANFDKDSIKSNSAGDGISIDYIHDKQTYSLDIALGLKNNQIYSSGSLNENSSNGAWFDRSLEVYGLELVLAGNVGGQSAVPDEWAYKVAETVKFLINPYVSEVNEVSQSNLIKTLLGNPGTWHNGFQTAQRIANEEGDMYSPNPLQNPESYVGYEAWLDSHMQNDMIWYQNEATTDNIIVEVLEHLMHTIHPFGVRGAVDGSFDALMGSDIEVESSQEYKSKDLYLAMKQAMDNGVFNPDYIDAPDNVLLKEYTYLLNFGMWEFGKEFWDDDENGEGSLAPEWGDNARTPDGILSNNPLGYQLFNAYFDPVLTRPEPQALREIFQNIENGSRYLDLIQPLPGSDEFLLHVEIVIV